MPKPTTFSEYLESLTPEAQQKLLEIRALLKEVAPNAKEVIKWGVPVLEEKRILFSYSAHRTHLNFMPTRSTLVHFIDELKDYKNGRDTIQFEYDKPLPKALIKKIAKCRVKEVKEGDALWMHHAKK